MIDSAIARKILRKGEFLKYFQSGGLKEWDKLPGGVNELGLRFRFEFVTQSGDIRQYDGYIIFRRQGTDGWQSTQVNVDGQGDISAKVFQDGGFVIR